MPYGTKAPWVRLGVLSHCCSGRFNTRFTAILAGLVALPRRQTKPVAVGFLVLTAVVFTLLFTISGVYGATFGLTTPGTTIQGSGYSNLLMGSRFSLSESGTVASLSVYIDGTPSGNVKLAIYSHDSVNNIPNALMVQSASVGVSSVGWLTAPVSSTSLTAGNYWLVVIHDSSGNKLRFNSGGSSVIKSMSFGSAFPSPWGGTGGTTAVTATYSIYATYSSGQDFAISASPASQNIAAGSTASFTLNLVSSGGFSSSVSLSVTSGCPSSVTCSVSPSPVSSFPGSATLSVPTLITTTGSYSVIVTATNGTITHTATVTVTVAGPTSYTFNVRPGATQIVVTVSWTGTASASVTVAGPGGSPTLSESGAVGYDRTSIIVSGGSPTYASIHRVTFTITAPTSTQTWSLLLSISGTSTYNVTIEVS